MLREALSELTHAVDIAIVKKVGCRDPLTRQPHSQTSVGRHPHIIQF
jgi:hypothetical protein